RIWTTPRRSFARACWRACAACSGAPSPAGSSERDACRCLRGERLDQDAGGLPAIVEALASAHDAEAALQEQIQRRQVAVGRAQLEQARLLSGGDALERLHQAMANTAPTSALAHGDGLDHEHVPCAPAEREEADAAPGAQRDQGVKALYHVDRMRHGTRCEFVERLVREPRDEGVVRGL